MTCKAGIPDSMCELSQETEDPRCIGCDDNKVGSLASDYGKTNAGYNYARDIEGMKPFWLKYCKKEGCKRNSITDIMTRGLCGKHYQRMRQNKLGNED